MASTKKITIYDGVFGSRPTRFFQQDRSGSGAMFLDSDDPTDLVYEYTKYYSLYKVFKPDVRKALVIGGGAYSIPKALLAELPNAAVDVSEIEPSLFDLAKEYFDLEESPNLHNTPRTAAAYFKTQIKDMI
jgi:spermidine synthase